MKEPLFPACAGVILICVKNYMTVITFPRVCGGDPEEDLSEAWRIIFSPRVRG